MDLSEMKSNARSRIKKAHSSLLNNLNGCVRISTAELTVNGYQSDIAHYARAVQSELQAIVWDLLQKKLNKINVEKETADLLSQAGELAIPKLKIDFTKRAVPDQTLSAPIHSPRSEHRVEEAGVRINTTAVCIIGAGLLVGGGIGLAFVSKGIVWPIVGAAAGTAAGIAICAAAYGRQEEVQHPQPMHHTEPTLNTAETGFDRDYLQRAVSRQQEAVTKCFLQYLEQVENVCVEAGL